VITEVTDGAGQEMPMMSTVKIKPPAGKSESRQQPRASEQAE
jgi:hypothetical protein